MKLLQVEARFDGLPILETMPITEDSIADVFEIVYLTKALRCRVLRAAKKLGHTGDGEHWQTRTYEVGDIPND